MQKHALFLIGEAEYASQDSMPSLISEFEEKYKWKVTTCISNPIEDGKDIHEFEGMDQLDDVDALVIYTRFRNLSKRQMEMILQYLEKGKPVVGLRTSTHSFAFPEDSEYYRYNDDFGNMLFGTPWRIHHGHTSTTELKIVSEKHGHPILNGVDKRFFSISWLYHVTPLPEQCDWLLMGKAIHSEYPDLPMENPVAWTNIHNGGRVFYTSLGHPKDFECTSFRNLVMNGILWVSKEI